MNRKHPLILAALLSMSIHSVWALEPINTTIIKSADLEFKIKPEQEARIKSITENMNLQIKKAFKGEEALQNEMQAELERVVNITDQTAQMAAVNAYQNKYKSRYQAILAKGKVNLADLSGELNAAVPEMEFTVTPNMLIKAKSRMVNNVNPNQILEISEDAQQSLAVLNKKNISKSNEPQIQTTQARNNPTAMTLTLNMDDYTDDPRTGCGLFGGVDNTLNGKTIKLIGATVQLGKCNTSNDRRIELIMPGNTRATVTVTADLYCYGFSAAVGLSLSSAKATAKIKPSTPHRSCAVNSIATLLWAGYEEDPAKNVKLVDIYENHNGLKVTIEPLITTNDIELFSMGPGGARAEAKISNFTVKVKLEPRIISSR